MPLPSTAICSHRARAGAAVGLAAGLLGLALASAPTADAATSTQVSGTVVAVSTSAETFTIKASTGKLTTVRVSGATLYRDSLVTTPSFADVRTGDSVVALGALAKGVETATVVIIGGNASGVGSGQPEGPGRFGFGGGTAGTVTSVDAAAGTFVVKTRTGTAVTVKVTSSTTYRDRQAASATLADVKVGTTVFVLGSTTKGTETARSVIIGGFRGGPGGFGRLRGATVGTVTAIDKSKKTFVVKTTANKKLTVKVTTKTIYRDRQSTSASWKDVKVGATVAVTGTTKSGVETATSVNLGAPGGFGGFANATFGAITAVDKSKKTFVVKTTANKKLTVKVTTKTTYRDRQSTSASWKDVKVGATVAVTGTTKSGVETATSITLDVGTLSGAPLG